MSAPSRAASGAHKRPKKRTPVVQNQFFLHHVREMRDLAVAKNWQSKHTYAKMVRALESYPLRLEAPRACLILEGFGQKTCETLQSKLADYAKELGVSEEEALRTGNERFATPTSLKLKLRKPPKKRARLSELDSADASAVVADVAGTSSGCVGGLAAEDSEAGPATDNSALQQSQLSLSQQLQRRPYNPKPRSGAHAILLTLLQSGGTDCRLNKADLITLAQPLCDSSFTCPAAGSHYTAWSAMGDLVKRGFIDRAAPAGRNPGSYTLTQAGRTAAASLMSADATHQMTATSKAKQPVLAATSKAKEPALAATSKAKEPALAATLKAKEPVLAATLNAKEPALAATSKAKKSAKMATAQAKSLALAATSKAGQPVHAISDSEEEFDANGDLARLQPPLPPSPPLQPGVPANYSVHTISDSEVSKAEAEVVEPPPSPQQPQVSIQFDYCSENNYAIVASKTLAWRKFDPLLDCDCVLIVCEYEQLVRSNLHYSLDLEAIGRFADGLVAAFVRERDLPELGTKTAAAAAAAAKAAKAQSAVSLENMKALAPVPLRTVCSNPTPIVGAASVASLLPNQPLITYKSLSWQRQTSATAPASSAASASGTAPAGPVAEEPQARLIYTIQPDQFDVIFCIDNREHFGMGSVKQMLLPGLLRNNVKCDVRPLQVSDFLWVAKCRESGREAVLNLLVERKRLDDLASSIKDGRFREQKFRLRRSGIAQLLLLVEGFGGRAGAAGHVRMPEETLSQSVCNSQLIDRCTVKYTDSAQHTVGYLTMLTSRLIDMYKGRRLMVYDSMPGSGANSDSRPNLSGILPFRAPGSETSAVDFGEFNRAAIKSKRLVVREMLAKHLLQIGGVTMEKAFAIVQQYPTVQALLDAFATCQSEAEKRRLLSSVCHNRLFDKRIGDSISKSVRLSLHPVD